MVHEEVSPLRSKERERSPKSLPLVEVVLAVTVNIIVKGDMR